MIIEGDNAIQTMRDLIKVLRQKTPSILGEEHDKTQNVLHGSDCEECIKNEINIYTSLKKKKGFNL